MQPVKIKDANADYAKPVDWDDRNGSCGSLPIRRTVEGTPGAGAFLSLKSNWKPTKEELVILNAGGVVELECCGVQPAVSLTAVPCADESIDTKTSFQMLQEAVKIAVSPGNYDSCSYMHGMANGMIFAESCLQERTPVYLDAPSEWSSDWEFKAKLAGAANYVSRENRSNTPDFILASFMEQALAAAEALVRARDRHYGIAPSQGEPFAAAAPATGETASDPA